MDGKGVRQAHRVRITAMPESGGIATPEALEREEPHAIYASTPRHETKPRTEGSSSVGGSHGCNGSSVYGACFAGVRRWNQLGCRRRMRIGRQLEHQYRKRLLGRAAVLAADMAGQWRLGKPG